MRLIFTKRSGKYDELVIERDGQKLSPMPCPKQGIIPHDMVHYGIESTLGARGFLGLIAGGEEAAFTTRGGEQEQAIERLVEVFQAEMWGGRVEAAELIDAFEQACAAHGHPSIPVSPDDIEAVRERLDELTSAWSSVSENSALTLEM